MRIFATLLVAGLCLAGVTGCSHPKPPTGHWEGAYESGDMMVLARLQIASSGAILVSTPRTEDIAAMSAVEKSAARQKLAQTLADGWDDVEPRVLDFDGVVFHKRGDKAPQMEWDTTNRHMTLIVRVSGRSAIRIPLHAVKRFSDNPWM